MIYFLIRITLKNLQKINKKLEYREVKKELETAGFHNYFNENEFKYTLPDSMYCIPSPEYTAEAALDTAEAAIQTALKKYYSTTESRYTIVLSGPSPIANKKLDRKNHTGDEGNKQDNSSS